MQWRLLLPKGVGLIHVDIGGHPPLPIGLHIVFILAVFLAFQVLNFWGHFEALKNIFWARHNHNIGRLKVLQHNV
jgi:hypothetical protein